MRKLSLISANVKKIELNEYHLSIIIHLFLFLFLSIYMGFKTIPHNKQKVFPVTLFAKIDKAEIGASAIIKKEKGAKKAVGNTNKFIKNKDNNISKNKKTKSNVKPIDKATKKAVTKVNKKKETKPTINKKSVKKTDKKTVNENISTVVAVKTASTNLPSVISKTLKETSSVKPTHNTPLFEEVSDLSVDFSKSNPNFNNFGGNTDISNNSMLKPESVLDDSMMFATPSDINKTGDEEDNSGNSIVEIDSIEAFGGNIDNFKAPSIVKKVQPDYPEWARKQGIHGKVVYRVLILPSGTVGDVIAMSSTIDPKLAINGAQTLRRWVFTPILNNGTPQETWVKISVQYELK